MILKLDDNHQIVTDERNFILQKKTNPKKNLRKGDKATKTTDPWKNIGFWQDLSQLLTSYTRKVLRGKTGKSSLTAVLRDLRSLRQAIERIGKECVTLWGKG